MKKIISITLIITVFSACSSSGQIFKIPDEITSELLNTDKPLSEKEVADGLKEALTVGTGKTVDIVSLADGYFKNAMIKVLFPPDAVKVEKKLREMGLGEQCDKMILSLNRAAEDASKEAKPIFISAIKQMTFADAMKILKGNDNAATEYLKGTTSSQLKNAFKPKIRNSLQKVNATKYWADVFNTYNQIPFVEKVNPDLDEYVTQKGMDGLFYMIAQEEGKIRKDPAARVTDLLKKVFGKK